MVQFEARVTKLNRRTEPANGMVADISHSGVSVVTPMELTPGDSVELEMADSVLSGRVVYSRPDNLQFRAGITVDQIRLGGTGLSHLLEVTLNEAGVPGLEPFHIG